LEEDGFRGPVKTFTETHADYTLNETGTGFVEGPAVPYRASSYNRDGQLEETTFFKNGVENGKLLWEYSDDGLMKRRIDIDSQGRRASHEYSIEDAVTTQAVRANFDGTVGVGTKGDHDYQEYTYDSGGHLIERKFPQQGIRFVMKYGPLGRESESLEYKQGKLEWATHSTYEDNGHGDWIRRHETIWAAKYSEKGFVPWTEYYREITYYGKGGR
jgi:antitoxin component YwqK of YwqJK toxin-antitoxin module